MNDVNDEQRAAVDAGEGPVAIIAGPGTGKTKTLVARMQFLVAQGVAPGSILALTFTKKAAGEMAARFNLLAAVETNSQNTFRQGGVHQPDDAPDTLFEPPRTAPCISTFHGLCFELLNEKLGQSPDFIPELARLALIKKLPKPAAYKRTSARELSLLISRAKNMADTSPEIARLTDTYNVELTARNQNDFDDLLLKTSNLLQKDTAWRAQVQARFSHILVDEFQDTNLLQYEILKLLCGHRNIFVIGDPLQSIYGFRGAHGTIFDRFLADFPDARKIVLTTNYRSSPSIIALANALYPDSPPLTAHRSRTGAVVATELLNEYREADWIVDEIQKAIGGSDLQRAVSDDVRSTHRGLRDFAILYRNRAVARVVQSTLDASGLPFQIVGEGSPYDQPGVQTILQVLAKLAGPEREITSQDFTPAQTNALFKNIDAHQKPLQIAEQITKVFGLNIDASLRHLFGLLVRFTTPRAATDYFDTIARQNFYDAQAEAITLLTIHAAKGLEFSHVFLIGAEDGILPSDRADEVEEKRLFYVAVTRAKQRLDISHVHKRRGEVMRPSRFISDMPAAILPRKKDDNFLKDQRLLQKRQAKRAQATLF